MKSRAAAAAALGLIGAHTSPAAHVGPAAAGLNALTAPPPAAVAAAAARKMARPALGVSLLLAVHQLLGACRARCCCCCC
jgi:hypothetical protein